MHGPDLTGVAIVIAVAVVLGLGLTRFRQPAIVGYILAGVVLGPTGFGLVAQTDSVALLAELGVLMLLFLIGMELSLKAFVRVLVPASLTVLGQIAAALVIAYGFGALFGWPLEQSLLLGFIVALSSTAVAMKMLSEIGELRTPIGQITIGVLIGQDLAVVPMLIIVASLGGGPGFGFAVLVKIAVAIALLIGLVAFFSRRGKLRLPFAGAISGNVDLIALTAMAACFCAAALSGLVGLSPAYGAFLAGLVVANSTLRAEAIRVTEPIQSILMVVFFLSIGLLLDLNFILSNLLTVLLFVLGVIAVKSALNVALLHGVGEPWERAFPAGLMMAQIGEFSFVLAAAGLQAGAIGGDGHKLAISVIALTLLLSPFWMKSIRRFHDLARGGITDFREALNEVYSEEIHDLARGRAFAANTAHFVRRRIKAAKRARARALVRRRMEEARKAAGAEGPDAAGGGV